ncbi:alpha-1,4-glucan--maltose-1-phosphate maltosyltransferase [Boudabousia marimammalium]|uniref:Alpha-1,4-glucan:maltose-1-phosphate maltosyltransferase n=1 Tax=Boudabousia marimammalium TaxID=156892 RepID=A0A1Q5PSI5_9ACTO|nr:alpha-1,4-glucan--maltose-1-phosphate maltosyltransferase [Boudabousia marimammalium]OKL50370.1 alpha-1,4-glucan--maltose-1-phosphate maltosyltransferase [Boudabousia marimammalium]
MTRIPVTEVFPVIEDGTWPAKACEGEAFPVRATVFREGHDAFGVEAVLCDIAGTEVMRSPMRDIAPGLNRYEGWLRAALPGTYTFHIESWADPYATWAHDASIKVSAGTDIELMCEEGAQLMERAAEGAAKPYPPSTKVQGQPPNQEAQEHLLNTAAILRDRQKTPQERISAGLSSLTRKIFGSSPLRDLADTTRKFPLNVDRRKALTGSWYEIFPRSIGAEMNPDGTWTSGTFRETIKDLDRISEMGFDVLYLTPIHPIGTQYRKGKNNTLNAGPNDPGSPYGIGAPEGGHDALHPDLGTWEDFAALVEAAKEHGLEIALDLALQCSPDHPWVKEHPEWFTTRVDGTIAYAENPPKKYQDIYPLNFDNDPEGIYHAIREVVEKWVEQGVTIFRVDNPHTKPLIFWQRLLHEMRQSHPEVLFLAEAFTKPAMMRTLGAIGFHQSYTYFTWRTSKTELQDYFLELAQQTDHLMRPAFWPTTHDILTPQMTDGGRNAFAIRAVLAATGSPTWGIYSGYELVESDPRPGFEEQNNNEKYEYRPRDWSQAEQYGIAELLKNLNLARSSHEALQQLRGLTICDSSSDDVIAFVKHLPGRHSASGKPDAVIVVVNLDPHEVRESMVGVDPALLGVELAYGQYRVRDMLDGQTYTWSDYNYVKLDPSERVAHVFEVMPL